jgi:hypothetical protein
MNPLCPCRLHEEDNADEGKLDGTPTIAKITGFSEEEIQEFARQQAQ